MNFSEQLHQCSYLVATLVECLGFVIYMLNSLVG